MVECSVWDGRRHHANTPHLSLPLDVSADVHHILPMGATIALVGTFLRHVLRSEPVDLSGAIIRAARWFATPAFFLQHSLCIHRGARVTVTGCQADVRGQPYASPQRLTDPRRSRAPAPRTNARGRLGHQERDARPRPGVHSRPQAERGRHQPHAWRDRRAAAACMRCVRPLSGACRPDVCALDEMKARAKLNCTGSGRNVGHGDALLPPVRGVGGRNSCRRAAAHTRPRGVGLDASCTHIV